MKPEQLEDLADVADMGGYIGADTADCIAAARAAAASMRQPITAEALTADGWVEDYRTDQYGGLIVFSQGEAKMGTPIYLWDVETSLDGSLKRVVDSRSMTVKYVRTMYDLRELVRLLGGENA